MNRLVIVGNGFDLAHGLPTGYCDFIDWYWKRVISSLEFPKDKYGSRFQDNLLNIELKFYSRFPEDHSILLNEFREINCFKSLRNFILTHSHNNYDLIDRQVKDNCYLIIKNNFFKIISERSSIQNWVDIENEYYKQLKDCLKDENDNSRVKNLNEEFEQVKKLLEEYLKIKICNAVDFSTSKGDIFQLAELFDIKERFLYEEKYLKEFPRKYHANIKQFNEWLKDFKEGKSYDISKMMKSKGAKVENLFLTFNYTPTLKGYNDTFVNSDINYYGINETLHIHGEIGDINNKVNFGFGDEMDDDYKKIENKDDNEYLKNIKSFQYFQNSNYRRMLDFVDSEEFQVYVMGHSCGLSDRILLNKIFEHHNCASIKVFYYKNGDWDNYTEIVQNISRHFNKKEMMREKIVNKSLCQPLPQTIRFAKKENGSQ